ncbi:MAG TPA: DNA polymerase III subunit alpha, partial [Aquificales bacterium]|nr:DNA polymerase III subunit alpha [Aquificales bacterium]
MLGSGEIKPIKEVSVGDFVLTHRGAVLPVLNTYRYEVNEELVEVEIGGEKLTLTGDHKVLALQTEKCRVKSVKETVCKPTCNRYCKDKPYEKYKLRWIPAEELKKDDFLVFPRQKSTQKGVVFDLLRYVEKSKALRWDENSLYYERGSNRLQTARIPRFVKFDHKLAKILGYFISEGYTKIDEHGGVVGFGFAEWEREYAEELLRLFKEVFNVEGKIFKSSTRRALKVEFKTKIVAQFLRNLCGDRAKNKRIPTEVVLHGEDEYVKTLIAYLFRGDGYDGRSSKTASIIYSTTSRTLAYQLRLLLARFGFWASVIKGERKRENWNTEYRVKLSGKQLLRWNETFKGFPIKLPEQRFFRNDSFFVDERFIYVKVRSVKKVPYRGEVYDITVPFDHSYTTSTVAIHNSAGGSLVAYALGITDIDPIKHDLLFERFLNPERVSMPDIDVDFCQDRRDDVIDYVRRKYGRDNVSQIITYNVLKSKSVIRDVCRALGIPLEKADRLAKLIPQGETQGSQLSLEEMTDWSIDQLKEKYGERPDIEDAVIKFRQMVNSDPSLKRAVDIAKKLDGLTRHTGFHAAGVVIAPKPLIELVPLYARKEKDKETKQEKFIVATQYDMGVLEEIGLLKMDFLGLKTLTELDHMKKMVKDLYGEDIDLLSLNYEDPKVYDLLKSGRTTGVFQLESRGMQQLLVRLKPDRFDDLIAVLALYRPGPLKSGLVDSFVRRKHGEEPIEYEFPQL